MKFKIIILFFVLSILLVGCTTNSSEVNQQVDIKQLVKDLNENKTEGLTASITSTELVIKDENGKETVHDLSNEDFFISIAPYLVKTHVWTNHFLTGCKGELVNKNFEVLITNMNGDVIIEKIINSGDNGFLDFWLPRNTEYKVQIKYQDKISEMNISTFVEDPTCITTMKLK